MSLEAPEDLRSLLLLKSGGSYHHPHRQSNSAFIELNCSAQFTGIETGLRERKMRKYKDKIQCKKSGGGGGALRTELQWHCCCTHKLCSSCISCRVKSQVGRRVLEL